MRDVSDITGYHAHVYYDVATRAAAARVRESLGDRFVVEVGRWHERAVGPHPRAMYQVAFAPDELARILPWLMLNREGLDILVHPVTGDEVADHATNALWLGERLALDIELLRQQIGSVPPVPPVP